MKNLIKVFGLAMVLFLSVSSVSAQTTVCKQNDGSRTTIKTDNKGTVVSNNRHGSEDTRGRDTPSGHKIVVREVKEQPTTKSCKMVKRTQDNN